MKRLQGKTALITGASSGIGLELARQAAPYAKALVLVARRHDRLEALAKELEGAHPQLAVHIYPCDLSDMAALEALLGHLTRDVPEIDVLINNAGFADWALFDKSAWSRQKRIIDVNVTAPLRLTHALVPGMVARGRGGILNVGSGVVIVYLPGSTSYVGSKGFIDGFSENLRLELRGTGVTVTQVLPGPVATEIAEVAGEPDRSAGPVAISAARCAREALLGFERGQPLVFPGRLYRTVMRILPFMPRPLRRRLRQAQAVRLRGQT